MRFQKGNKYGFKKGDIPWNKGKKRSITTRKKISIANTRKISLKPTFNLGYFCGLVLGDGWIHKTKGRNYRIGLETTDNELSNLFIKSARKLGLTVGIFKRNKFRKFKSGHTYNNESIIMVTNSKIIFDALRPYKQEDFNWNIPKFLVSEESQKGFLRGFFDAEGNVSKTRWSQISITSKHQKGMIEIKKLLFKFGIETGKISRQGICYRMYLLNKSRKMFLEVIGFGLSRKRRILESVL